MELKMVHFVHLWNGVPLEIGENRMPVDTVVTVPMRTAGILVIDKIGMEFAQFLPHHAGQFGGHHGILIAMQDMDPRLQEISFQAQGAATV